MVEPERNIVIGSQSTPSHGQQLIAHQGLRLFPKPHSIQRDDKIVAAHERACVRDTKRSHNFGEHLAFEGESLAVPSKVVEAARESALRVKYKIVIVRKIAQLQSQRGLNDRKRFIGPRLTQ
mmetsp:Transcript_29402/g.88453  ORF Transcript_29402/g.88453 Transcript_29402/m.88453 type:complete len:122 (-) Transcript_29402:146-511(-)